MLKDYSIVQRLRAIIANNATTNDKLYKVI